jgi:nicotinamide N-methyltransferase
MSDEEENIFDGAIFEEPEDFKQPVFESHFVKYDRKLCSSESAHGIKEITLRLVGKSPLWGHLLWNAGVYTANFIETKAEEYVKNKKIIEFGAASALPSLLCALNGASIVICTDYPDADLLSNIKYNVDHLGYPRAQNIINVEPYIWGHQTNAISAKLGDNGKADFLIMSDLVFNHSEHHKLLKSCKDLIKPLQNGKARTGGKCLVVWSPHRPKLLNDDLKFFTDAEELFDFDVEMVEMVHWEHPMFPEEPAETEEIRKRIYCYILHPTW